MNFRTVGRVLYPLALLTVPVLTVSVCWVVSRSHGSTAAMVSMRHAAVENNVPAARALLDSGCPVNTTADGGPTPLAWAAVSGHTEMASFLLSRGADLHLGSLYDGRSPLHWAVVGGHAGMVRFLTARGANVNAPDARGCTPLHVAYEFGRHDIVRALLACGANPRATDQQGRTPQQASDPADDEPAPATK